MPLIYEQGNIIDNKLPITGNIKNPKLHLNDVIEVAIGNIL